MGWGRSAVGCFSSALPATTVESGIDFLSLSLKASDVPREPPLPAGRTEFLRANLVERVEWPGRPGRKRAVLVPGEARPLPSALATARRAKA